MDANSETSVQPGSPPDENAVEMPRPTASPLILCLGLTLLAAGTMLGLTFMAVGAVVFVAGLVMWIGSLLPGRGHLHEARVEARRPMATTSRRASVEQLRPGIRVRLPETIHPVSAGIKGGIIGGMVMPLPAFVYGLASHHGIWYPINLLAGMALPGIGSMSEAQLEQFSLTLLIIGIVIHAMISVIFGLLYGVLLPTLPDIAGLPLVVSTLAWGGLVFPILWSGVSYSLMGVVNPVLQVRVNWPWFIVSQFVFGTVAALVVDRSEIIRVQAAGPGPTES